MLSCLADLGDNDPLTSGEILYLYRRRLGLTQMEMATAQGMSRHQYAQAERDQMMHQKLNKKGVASMKVLHPYEKCVIYRRRTNTTQKTVAQDLNLSRVWINRLERGEGDPSELLCYWEA